MISYCHIFSYSERENTSALHLKPVVSKHERLNRSKTLRLLSDKKREQFFTSQLNSTRQVLVENCEEGICFGLTDNYIRVQFDGNESFVNSIQEVNLLSPNDAMVNGVITS
jgi:threonylcarbamoyladenosine tRNA methylthiotransferase MtaB